MLFAGVFFVFTLNIPDKASPMIQAPEFRSVVYADNRSVCQKKSEIAISQAWGRACKRAGKQDNCELTTEAAKTAYNAGQFVIDNCKD